MGAKPFSFFTFSSENEQPDEAKPPTTTRRNVSFAGGRKSWDSVTSVRRHSGEAKKPEVMDEYFEFEGARKSVDGAPDTDIRSSQILEHLRRKHEQALRGKASSLTTALIIAGISSVALALIKITIKRHDTISSTECVFFVALGILIGVIPATTEDRCPFGPASAQRRLAVSAVLTTLAYILGYRAVQFMSVLEATIVAGITPLTTWWTSVAIGRRAFHWVMVPTLVSSCLALVFIVKPPFLGFKSMVHRDMGIGAACGLSSTLLVGVENAFKTNLPGVTRRAVLFHLSVVMMMGSFATGAAASSFQLIRQGPEISAMMFVTYLSFVSHVSLAKQVKPEHAWIVLLVRIVANIVCAVGLELAFINPTLLDSFHVMASALVVFAGSLLTLHMLVSNRPQSGLVRRHRLLQLFA